MRSARIVTLCLPFLLLSGCSGEPSEAEIRTAVEAHLRRAAAASAGFTDFRKQGCVNSKQAPGAFDCYYSATLVPPGAKPLTVNGKARFTPGDKGFAFQDLGAQPR